MTSPAVPSQPNRGLRPTCWESAINIKFTVNAEKLPEKNILILFHI